MKRILLVAVLSLAAPAFGQVTKVETVPGPTCFMWGGSSGSQGQFSNCSQTTIITVTQTEVKKVEVPVPVPVPVQPEKKIRE